ncbi:hypothetical protein [Conyzicola sp.]|uniref:hypothetical protein n=1 Tax=Conyzicola sp. TaxID=1969404 RepID=UPI00398A505A
MITLAATVPHRDFLEAMLARHYTPAATPTVLITTDPHTPVVDTVARIILITDDPLPSTTPTVLPTLVIGRTALPDAAHVRLATTHPAELLSVIDGYLRHPERFPVGATTAAARV